MEKLRRFKKDWRDPSRQIAGPAIMKTPPTLPSPREGTDMLKGTPVSPVFRSHF